MTEADIKASRRELVVHDSLAFLILSAATAILFVVTLFLFRSFAAHRADLARRFSDQGRTALAQGKPVEAIAALRSALSYAGTDHDDELLLAQALGEAGHLDESTNYFLNLWESQPGDGFINLQLARMARRKQEKQRAINYYRASTYGSWNGDGVLHRREVRLELADYLVDVNEFRAAQAELLVAASNSPRNSALDLVFGDALLHAHDPVDASREYQTAFADDPQNAVAYEKAGRLAYRLGDFTHARDWLKQSLRESAGAPGSTAGQEGDIKSFLKDTERILVLDPDRADTEAGKILRLLTNRAIARKRLDTCAQQSGGALPQPLQRLGDRWTASNKSMSRSALARNPANQDLLRMLIDDTEIQAGQLCGAPEGDDALLLKLASRGKMQ